MAVDAFLQFKEVGDGSVTLVGETRDNQMKNDASVGAPVPFEIKDWGFAVENTYNIGSQSGGGGTGKAKFEGFKIKKSVDSASPNLFYTCCVGGHYNLVNLFCRRAGGVNTASGLIYLKFSFKMVAVKSITWASSDEAPDEDVEFEFGALQFTYTAQLQTGGAGAKSETQWSQVLNANEFAVE